MKSLALAVSALCFSVSAAQAEFSMTFEWGDIPRCTSGSPNTVGNPRFVLHDIPAGTQTIEFRLRDLNAPNYNHGGGRVTTNGATVIPFGTFRYRSPCPPGGVHTYRWTATARNGNSVLGSTTAERQYPE